MQKRLTKTGNSLTLTITREMRQQIGVEGDVVDIQMMGDKIIISAPKRQSFEDAAAASFAQYDNALRNLKD
jgi:antitoxin component of MazEF toxin-antitoxin module